MTMSKCIGGCFECVTVVWVAAVLAGCGDPGKEYSGPAKPDAATRDARGFGGRLTHGMPTNEIVAQIGRPSEEEVREHSRVWTYYGPGFATEEESPATEVYGIKMLITNGCLADWADLFTMLPDRTLSREQLIEGENPSPIAIEFYTVYDSLLDGGLLVDTSRFPQLGFISATPDLAVTHVDHVKLEHRRTSENGSDRDYWVFTFGLASGAAKAFEAITTTNLGRKVLITVAGEPIAAPEILSPIMNGIFEIDLYEESQAEILKAKLIKAR